MARTLRRRHALHWEKCLLSDVRVHLTAHGGWSVEHVTIDRRSDEGRHILMRFHADRPFRGTVPKPFRQAYHRSDRMDCRQALHRWLARGDHDFLAPSPHRHSARWDWW